MRSHDPAKRNLAVSVAARLLNHARRTGDDYQTLVTAYAFERFLYRLGMSDRSHTGYWENPSRPPQVRAFARRAGLAVPEHPGREFTDLLGMDAATIGDEIVKHLQRLIIVAHTDRDEAIRLISAREVTAAERNVYEEEPK